MELNYDLAQRLEGEIVRFKNDKDEWSIGKITKVNKNGVEISELQHSGSDSGFGYGFWGPGPFWGPPFIVPFIGFAFFPLFW